MSTDRHHAASRYEIRLRGHLDRRWAAWFDGMILTSEGGGITLIRGPVVDQAALHGLLHKLRDLNLSLVSVTQVESAPGPQRPSVTRRSTGADGTSACAQPRPRTKRPASTSCAPCAIGLRIGVTPARRGC